MIIIRRAKVEDAVEISRVHVESWRTTYPGIVPNEFLATLKESDREPVWREQLTRAGEIYVANLDGEVVGFIAGGPIREAVQAYDAELYAIYLLQRAQGQGIGTSLLKELVASLIEKRFQSMLVWVLEKNPATHFYVKSSAQLVTSKPIRIGSALLVEQAYGWPDLKTILVVR